MRNIKNAEWFCCGKVNVPLNAVMQKRYISYDGLVGPANSRCPTILLLPTSHFYSLHTPHLIQIP